MKLFEQIDASLMLDEDEQQVLDSVRRLCVDSIAPRADGFDRRSEFPQENIDDINALGLNMMFVPQAYGGVPLSYCCYLACVREISKACAATGIIWATTFHGMKPLIEYGDEAQKQRLLPRIANGGLGSLAITEPEAGSDATGMTLKFTPDGDDIIVDGTKTFISNGDVADLFLLFGKWSEIEGRKEPISALIFERDTAGFEVLRVEKKLGHRASSTAAIAFNQCRVPRDNLLGQPGQGLEILLQSLNTSRPSVAAHALGIARAAFEDAIEWINERKQSGRRIVEFQGIQFLIADLAAELAQAECWLWHVGRLIESGESDFGVASSVAKLRASDLAMRIATESLQLHGGYGYIEDYRIERLFRDAKITQIWEGTNQIHRQFVGRSFLSRD